MNAQPKPQSSYEILKFPNFRILLATRTFTTMALMAQAVIVGWQVYSITKDPFLLGLIGLVEAVPALICALFAGHIVDISRPYKVYLLCVGAHVINTLILAAIAGGFVAIPQNYLLYVLFTGVFFSGIARSFLMPASFTLLSEIVARKDIPSASSWLSSGFQIASIGGPAIAGLVYGGYGAHGAWLMPLMLLFMAFSLLFFLKVPHKPRTNQKREPMIQSIKAGMTFILKTPIVLNVMMLDMFAVLFGGAVAMLPAFADEILHVGSEGLGALRAAPAVGAVITSLFFSLVPMQKFSALRLLWTVAGFGVCMVGFGLSTSFWLSMVFLALSGAFDSISVIIRNTIMQLMTPDSMRGRVSSVNSMFIISSNEIGAFESGVAARFMGLVPSVVFGGMMTLAVVGLTALLSPKFRKAVVRVDDKMD